MNETNSNGTNHEQTVNEKTSERRQASSAIEELVATGLGWAQYGLAMGQQSLQASAKTLDAAATFLGEISERLTKRPEEPAKQ